MIRPFFPDFDATIAQANATSSAGGTLPEDIQQVALYNSSATATVYWACRVLNTVTEAGPAAVIPAGSTRGAMPIPPGAFIRVSVARGPKRYATIATAADGTLFITPGEGN